MRYNPSFSFVIATALALAAASLVVPAALAQDDDIGSGDADVTVDVDAGTWDVGASDAKHSTCLLDATQTVSPQQVVLGEAVDVTVTIRSLCIPLLRPVHIVFVMDPMAGMERSGVREMRQLALNLVGRLDLENNPDTKVGVVAVGAAARTLTAPTNDAERVVTALEHVDDDGDTDTRLDLGLRKGLQVLRQARAEWLSFRYPVKVAETLVVLTAASDARSCQSAQAVARDVKRDGILVVVVAFADDPADARCLTEIATSSRYYFHWASAFQPLPQCLCRHPSPVVVSHLVVEESLANGMAYVPDSAAPAPIWVRGDGRQVFWSGDRVPKGGLVLTYRVRADVLGRHPVSKGVIIRYKDNEEGEGRSTLPALEVQVVPRALGEAESGAVGANGAGE